jgi:ribonuclease HIII
VKLSRGVSASVKQAAKDLVAKNGPEVLRQVAKVHFRTAHEIAPDSFAAPPPRTEWRR